MLGFKIMEFSSSAFPGLFQNVLTFIHRWYKTQNNADNFLLGFFEPHFNTLMLPKTSINSECKKIGKL